MNKFFKISLIGLAIYSAYQLGQLKKIKKEKRSFEKPIIKKGTFSKEIENFQKNINGIYGFEKLKITGAFCNKTKNEIDKIFKDSLMYNIELGSIEKQGLKEINKVLFSINNNITGT